MILLQGTPPYNCNRPNYSYVLSNLAFEWNWGWRWHCFDKHLSAIHVHHSKIYIWKEMREVFIKTRSTPASLPLKRPGYTVHNCKVVYWYSYRWWSFCFKWNERCYSDLMQVWLRVPDCQQCLVFPKNTWKPQSLITTHNLWWKGVTWDAVNFEIFLR